MDLNFRLKRINLCFGLPNTEEQQEADSVRLFSKYKFILLKSIKSTRANLCFESNLLVISLFYYLRHAIVISFSMLMQKSLNLVAKELLGFEALALFKAQICPLR